MSSESRKFMIQALQADPGDLPTRAVCADALEEEGYRNSNVLKYLREGELPKRGLQEIRAELREVFGSVTAIQMEPALYPPEYHEVARIIQDPTSTPELRRGAIVKIEHFDDLFTLSLVQEMHDLQAVAAIESKDPFEAMHQLEYISDIGLKAQLVQTIIASKEATYIQHPLADMSDLELQRELTQAIVASKDASYAYRVLPYVSDIELQKELVQVIVASNNSDYAWRAMESVSDLPLQMQLVEVITVSKNALHARYALESVSNLALQTQLVQAIVASKDVEQIVLALRDVTDKGLRELLRAAAKQAQKEDIA